LEQRTVRAWFIRLLPRIKLRLTLNIVTSSFCQASWTNKVVLKIPNPTLVGVDECELNRIRYRAVKAASEGGPRARIDWGAVISKLPKQFTAADVRKVRGLAEKKASEIFAAITGWINTKLVRRKDRGVYERVE
jgi:hypothetical protein